MCPKGEKDLSGPMASLSYSSVDGDTRTQEFRCSIWKLCPGHPDLLSTQQAQNHWRGQPHQLPSHKPFLPFLSSGPLPTSVPVGTWQPPRGPLGIRREW